MQSTSVSYSSDSTSSLENHPLITTPKVASIPENDFSQKLWSVFFDYMPQYLSQRDLIAIRCLDQFWNRMSISWLQSQGVASSSERATEMESNVVAWLMAALDGNLETIKSLIKTNSELLNITNNNGDNACHIAVEYEHVHLMDFFQEHSNLMSQLNNEGFTPFHKAIAFGKKSVVKHLCDKDPAIIRATAENGTNGLQLAALANQPEIFELLYPYAQDLIHSKYEKLHHCNMLQLALSGMNLETIKWIVKKFPSQISETDDKGGYPVQVAVSNGHLETVLLLHKHNTSHIETVLEEGTALHMACNAYGSFDVFKHVYQNYPWMRMSYDTKKWLPFHVAISNDQFEMVQFYIKKHSKIISEKTGDGFNALHLAHSLTMTQHLYNLEPSLLFQPGLLSPLHFAAQKARLDIVEFYLSKRPELYSLKDQNGNNLLHFAILGIGRNINVPGYKEEQIKFVRYLTNKYPDLLQEKSKQGKFPYMYAMEFISKEIASEMITANLEYRKKLNAEKSKSQQPVSLHTSDPNFGEKWYTAIKLEDYETINLILQKNPEIINVITDEGINIAHVVTVKGQLNMVKFFCAYPQLFTQFNNDGFTPFHIAIINGKADIVSFLCGKGGDFTSKPTGTKKNPLQLAAIKGQYDIFEIIYKSNPELISELDVMEENCNMLHLAIEGGNSKIIESICKKCPSLISKCDDHGIYPIHDAIKLNQYETVKLLDRKCPSITKAKFQDGTSLHHACRTNGSFKIFKFLYDKYPAMRMPCTENEDKYLPFHTAIVCGNFEIVRFYIKNHKGILHSKIGNGFNVLHLSTDFEMIKCLYNSDPSILFDHAVSCSPLHLAASKGCLDIVEFYLNSREDLFKLKDESNCNILHYATRGLVPHLQKPGYKENQIKLVKYLINNYPQLMQDMDKLGMLPYQYAQKYISQEIANEMIAVNQKYGRDLFFNRMDNSQILETNKEELSIAPSSLGTRENTGNNIYVDEKIEKKAELHATNKRSKKKGSQITANSVKNEEKADAHQHIPSAPQAATETKEAPTLEIDSVKVSPADEKKVDQLPQELPLDQNASSTTPKESYFSEKTEKSKTEPAVVQRTKKPSTIERMKLKAVSTWNNTIGLSSAEKTRRREERKLLQRESMSVSVSQSDWSHTVRTERSEIEKSLADGEFESLVEALQTDNLDKKVMSETLQQLEKLNVIEIPNTNNDKVRANYAGECPGDKRPSLTIHKHNHDKHWDQQHKAQANFINFINECGLNTEEIKKQPSGKKTNTNDVAPDAGEG